MKMQNVLKLFLTGMCCLILVTSYAQNRGQGSGNYDAANLWNPFFYTQDGNEFRNADGTPGPKYWQNSVNYNINATLDTADRRLTATVEIDYTNNSPNDLSFLWLQLDQNIYKEDSRGTATQEVSGGRFANRTFTKGYEFQSVEIKGKGGGNADYVVNDTRMQIRLDQPLPANGGNIKLQLKYSFKIPEYGTDRMGIFESQDGNVFEIAQWFPRMSVYDNIKGWNIIPYMGAGEFYLEYGDIDYSVTVPSDMLVVGAGELVNPKDVLTKSEQKNLAKAAKSDETVMVRSENEVKEGASRSNKPNVTWHFHMKNTRDVAWAASKAFIWDAAKINLPEGKTALAQSVYPVESVGADAWNRSTEYTKASIEFYSKNYYPFPYPVATNVAGIVRGMEYPGFVFCSYKSTGSDLWGVTTHEFGHSWYPMIVGSNERKYPFLDEGINTFINDQATDWFNNGEFKEKKDNRQMASRMFSSSMDPILTIPDVTKNYNLGINAYYKPAMGFHILRDVILGPDRFDYALRKYTEDWAYKHPDVKDFFRAMDNAAGDDLSWFWYPWFYTNDALDQGIQSMKYVDNDAKKGALITLENKEQMALPVILRIKEFSGKDSTFTLPVEIWQRGDTWTFKYPSTDSIQSIVIDPEHLLPDVDDSNNKWEEIKRKKVPAGVSAASVINKYFTAIGGKEKVDAIKDFKMEASGSIQGQKIVMSKTAKLPDQLKLEVTVPSMDQQVVSKVVINGDEYSIENMGQAVPVTSDIKESLEDEKVIFPEQLYLKEGYKTELTGILEVEGKEAYELKVTDPKGKTSTSYYDVQSGLKVKSVEQEETQMGSSESTEKYSNYQEVDGIKFPFSIYSDKGGMAMEQEVTELKINSGVTDADFQ